LAERWKKQQELKLNPAETKTAEDVINYLRNMIKNLIHAYSGFHSSGLSAKGSEKSSSPDEATGIFYFCSTVFHLSKNKNVNELDKSYQKPWHLHAVLPTNRFSKMG
jgi:hypothetical protein